MLCAAVDTGCFGKSASPAGSIALLSAHPGLACSAPGTGCVHISLWEWKAHASYPPEREQTSLTL